MAFTTVRKNLSVLVFLAILCCFAGPALAGGFSGHEREAVALLNKERAAHGLSPLQIDRRLVELGRRHARDMADKGYFSHANPRGQTPFDRLRQAGVRFSAAGENIAADFSVANAHAALLKSSAHRANILKKEFDRVGIGVAETAGGQLYIVQVFIKAEKHPLYKREQYPARKR